MKTIGPVIICDNRYDGGLTSAMCDGERFVIHIAANLTHGFTLAFDEESTGKLIEAAQAALEIDTAKQLRELQGRFDAAMEALGKDAEELKGE